MRGLKMTVYNVAEMFASINGEGYRAGQPAFFVRFTGCNLRCSYCDTKWANDKNAPCKVLTAMQIYDEIKKSGIKNVTITGGEPLWREGIKDFLKLIASDKDLSAEIETNGSIDIEPFCDIKNRPSFTMDYKLPSSKMEEHMCTKNFTLLEEKDTVKFVSGSEKDLEKALEIIEKYKLVGKCHVYISPVFGSIEPSEIVDFMLKNKMNGVNLQLQMHKFIWDPNKRGV
jgi:7-carboxy-7-deazaguanine synthase